MQKSILPERLREQQKKRRKTDSNRQLSLIIFTALAIGLIAYGAYYFFLPKQEKFVLGFIRMHKWIPGTSWKRCLCRVLLYPKT